MNRNTRIFRLRFAPGSSESTPGRNVNLETLAAKTMVNSKMKSATPKLFPSAFVLPPGTARPFEAQNIFFMRRALIFFFFFLIFIVEAHAFSVTGTTYTTDGSAADVQNAINAAPAGATVTLPAGAFVWSTPITCSKAIKITGAGTTNAGGNFPGNITTNITDQYTGFTLVDLTPVLSGQLE